MCKSSLRENYSSFQYNIFGRFVQWIFVSYAEINKSTLFKLLYIAMSLYILNPTYHTRCGLDSHVKIEVLIAQTRCNYMYNMGLELCVLAIRTTF